MRVMPGLYSPTPIAFRRYAHVIWVFTGRDFRYQTVMKSARQHLEVRTASPGRAGDRPACGSGGPYVSGEVRRGAR